jgi:cytochrome P450
MTETQIDTVQDATEQLPEYPMPRDGACPFNPPPGLLALQDQPVAKARIWDGSTPWLITRHAEQRAILSDPRVSADDKRPGYPHLNRAAAESAPHRPQAVINMDGAEHTRIRRMLTPAFTVKRIAAARPAIQAYTDELIETMLAGPTPVDLVPALALPLPSMMIGELLGVPYADHEFFQTNTVEALNPDSPERAQAAVLALLQYLMDVIQSKITEPAEDVTSDLGARVEAGELSLIEAAILGVTLLVAGHETSANMIALGVLAVLQHPDQHAVLRESDDPALAASATEELLRYLTIAQPGVRRTATADIEIAGEMIHAGDGIVVSLSAVNWDPLVFPEPDRLDLRRDPRQHHAFSFGPHQCVGQQLARAELQIVFGTLFRRIPTLRLATSLDRIEFKEEELAYGVRELPVTW